MGLSEVYKRTSDLKVGDRVYGFVTIAPGTRCSTNGNEWKVAELDNISSHSAKITLEHWVAGLDECGCPPFLTMTIIATDDVNWVTNLDP